MQCLISLQLCEVGYDRKEALGYPLNFIVQAQYANFYLILTLVSVKTVTFMKFYGVIRHSIECFCWNGI